MRKLAVSEMDRLDPESFKKATKIPLTVVVDNVRSLSNVGSIFRSCDAFRVEKIYLCGITACPPHRQINKTALGATESVDWEYSETTEEVIHQLRGEKACVVSLEQAEGSIVPEGIHSLTETSFAVVVGHEVNGVSDEVISLSDYAVEIPQMGTKHSLNVSVATGIILWEFFKHLGPPK